ncbi:MAG: hypothetical protein NTV95_00090, partial [Candidatus Saccharibacteria bacterium]|nr:hypothetical protein [Candidatus Saccharibacteria bacterium]
MSYKPIVLAKFPKTKVVAAGISILLGVSIWLILGSLAPQRAHAAITLNPYPNDFFIPTSNRSYLENCNGSQSPAFTAWIALKDFPSVTSATVEEGTASIDLRYVFAGAVCRTDSPTKGTLNYIFGTSPGAEQLLNTAYGLDFRPDNRTLGTYRQANNAFTFSPPGGFNRSGPYRISLTTKSINQFANGKFRCVGGLELFVPSAFSFDSCQENTVYFNFYVTITPKDPISDFTIAPNCLSISVKSSDGNFAGGPEWTLEADYNTPSYKQLARGRGDGVYNITNDPTDRNYLYNVANHNITLVTYDVNSAGITIPGGRRSDAKLLTCEKFELTPNTNVQLLPDEESPDKATFGGGATRTTGTIFVKGVNIFRAYSYTKNGITNQLGVAPAAATNQTLGTFNFTTDLSRSLAGLGLVAGDCVRQSVTVSPGSGVVDANGNIVIRGPDKPTGPCKPIVNKPYVSFYGGDVNTCGGINTFYSPSRKRGSGVQYIAQANGSISNDGFISGSLLGGLPNRLTFANTTGPYGGSLGGTCSAPGDYFSGAPTAAEPATSTINLSSLNGNTVKSYNGNTTLAGGVLNNGSRTALYIEGDLRTTGDIGYASPSWPSEAEIPSLHVYVKGNIYIQPNVTNLTGFFVAQQKITTDTKGNI